MAVYLLLFILFLSDVFEFTGLYNISMYVAFVFPTIILLASFIKKRRIKVPAGALLYLVFLGISMVSILKSPDKEVAVETLFAYLGGFIVFIWGFNNSDFVNKTFRKYIISLSLFFIAFFVADKVWSLNLFSKGSSIFYYYDHNQIGNLLIPALFVTFPSSWSLFFVIFVISSYSRATFLSIFMAFLWQWKEKNLRVGWLSVLVVAALIILSFLSTFNYLPFKSKSVLGSREIYFSYALDAIKHHPVMGVGIGNFYLAASARQTNFNENTSSAHNIVLDSFAESGVVAGLLFSAFVIYALKKGKRGSLFYSFVALTFVFMFDFTHRFNSFLVLWFLLAGVNLKEEKTYDLNPFILIVTLIIYQPVLLSQLLMNIGYDKAALAVYPLRKEAYSRVIVKEIESGNYKNASEYLRSYGKYFGEHFGSTYKMARYYEHIYDFDRAIYYYQKTLFLRPFLLVADQVVLDRIYIISSAIYGKYHGRIATVNFLRKLESMLPNRIKKINHVFDTIGEYCFDNELNCYNYDH